MDYLFNVLAARAQAEAMAKFLEILAPYAPPSLRTSTSILKSKITTMQGNT